MSTEPGTHSRAHIRDTAATDRVIDNRSGRRNKRLALGAGLLTALAVAAFLIWPAYQRWASAEQSIARERLRFGEVTRGEFVKDVSVRGRVVAAVSPTLYSPISGTITLQVLAGDIVARGQELATIASPELQNRLETERSALQSAEIQIERQRIQTKQSQLENQQQVDLAKVRYEAAEREQRRAELGYGSQVINQIDYEKANDDLDTRRLEYRHAQDNAVLASESLAFELRTRELELDRQRLAVRELERQVTELTILSPVDGIIGTLEVQQKAAVTLNQPLLTVVDLSALEIDIQVPENYGDDLALGMETEITYGSQRYQGVLTAVSPEIRNNQVAGRVRFVNGTPPGLKQNQRVSARILLAYKEDAVTVQRGQFFESGGGRIAYVVDGDLAVRRDIETGATSIDRVEILRGLNPGETIIISDVGLFNGATTVFLSN